MLFVAVEVRPHGIAAGQLIDCGRMAFDLGKCRAGREPELLGKDVEDTGEANEGSELSDGAGWKTAQIDFAFFRGRHACVLSQ